LENARIAMGKQRRWSTRAGQTQFILDRTDSLVEMGYIKKKPAATRSTGPCSNRSSPRKRSSTASLKYKSG